MSHDEAALQMDSALHALRKAWLSRGCYSLTWKFFRLAEKLGSPPIGGSVLDR
jgi:hypothetical protein